MIIDEQHKFGVAQREELVRKGQYPHLLVMTATPCLLYTSDAADE